MQGPPFLLIGGVMAHWICQNPYIAVLIAAGVGYVIGRNRNTGLRSWLRW